MVLTAVCGTLACSYNPTKKYYDVIAKMNLHVVPVDVHPFTIHLVGSQELMRPFDSLQPNTRERYDTVHIYLEGDGVPWFRGNYPAHNPSSQKLTALHLMTRDSKPAIYINRPCYGLHPMPQECNAKLWTSARYSQIVIDSINSSLETIKHRLGVKKFVLIGHSGGGSIATLLAAKRDDVSALITIAANIDHQAWTEYFGYHPLSLSLNPVDVLPLDTSILQWHFVGLEDRNVPAKITRNAAQKDPQAKVIEKSDFNHVCCWYDIWPEILQGL